jgi:HK97 family phage prohead protease
MADKHFKLFDFEVKGGDANKRQIEAIASAPSIDRDGEIISIEALKAALPGYLRNPVILASHVHKTDTGNSSVVGKCVAARVDSAGLHITVEFAKTALGEEYLGLYKDKHQRAFSIGFMPIRYEDRQIKGKLVRVFTEIELMEISCVAVPSNRDALSKSANRKANFVGRKRQTAWDALNGPGSRKWCKRVELWSDLMDDPDQQKEIFTAAEQAEFGEFYRKAGEYSDAMNAYVPTPAEIRENEKLDAAEKRYAAKIGKSVDEMSEMEMLAALDLDEGIDDLGDLDDLLLGGKQYDFAAIVRGKKNK